MMKKFLMCVALLIVSGCSADISKYTTVDANASVKTKMKACLVSEANTKLQAGTLFAKGLSETSDELVDTCIKKLALQSAGISEESQSTATTIIQNLMNLSATK